MPDIDFKLMVASRVKKSCNTMRLAPADIGWLVNEIADCDLPEFFEVLSATEFCMTDDRRRVLSDGLAKCAFKIGLKAR